MNYYAHTAVTADGQPDPDESRWQLLKDHPRAGTWIAGKPLGMDTLATGIFW